MNAITFNPVEKGMDKVSVSAIDKVGISMNIITGKFTIPKISIFKIILKNPIIRALTKASAYVAKIFSKIERLLNSPTIKSRDVRAI